MHTRTLVLVGLLLAAVPGAPAVAQMPQPTLQFDRACYAEAMTANVSGAGYTPGGEVTVFFSLPTDLRGGYSVHADGVGALLHAAVFPDEDVILRDGENRVTLVVTATDITRAHAGQQPIESQFGFTQLTFTRWAGFSPGRFEPGRRVPVALYGWAFAAGETAWLLFRKGPRTVASVKVGRLDGDCGDREALVKVPKRLAPGRYRIVLSTERDGLSERYTWRNARVPATRGRTRALAAAHEARSMTRSAIGTRAWSSWRSGGWSLR
jgi:hypothetical protein